MHTDSAADFAESCEDKKDVVCQGTVWGPWLWNLYYGDAADAIRGADFGEILFADDLNAPREVPEHTGTDSTVELARDCQASLREWGAANPVRFDTTTKLPRSLARGSFRRGF